MLMCFSEFLHVMHANDIRKRHDNKLLHHTGGSIVLLQICCLIYKPVCENPKSDGQMDERKRWSLRHQRWMRWKPCRNHSLLEKKMRAPWWRTPPQDSLLTSSPQWNLTECSDCIHAQDYITIWDLYEHLYSMTAVLHYILTSPQLFLILW